MWDSLVGSVLAAVAMLTAGVGACGGQDKHAWEPPAVLIEPAGGGDTARVEVEIVATREKIRKGLMFRKELAPDAGMLFLMPREEVQSFWMRNTYIPLDMLFIGSDMIVKGVVENTEPLTDDSRTVGIPSLYVLEVNAGWAAKHGVAAGATVRFVNVDLGR